jgi:hypothetical protein
MCSVLLFTIDNQKVNIINLFCQESIDIPLGMPIKSGLSVLWVIF